MKELLEVIEQAKAYGGRLHDFLNDVTRCGLQTQFESVCENVGLIAYMLQFESSHLI